MSIVDVQDHQMHGFTLRIHAPRRDRLYKYRETDKVDRQMPLNSFNLHFPRNSFLLVADDTER